MDNNFKTVMQLVETYRLAERLFSDKMKEASVHELQRLGAFIKDGTVYFENTRIKL